MPRTADNQDWETFLGRRPIEGEEVQMRAAHAGKIILLTGAGGSIGSALATKLSASEPRLLLLLESSEQNLYQIHSDLNELSGAAPHVAILGDIADRPLLDEVFARHCPEIVYHAAAFKHVPMMESNPFAAIRNNALGTYALARAVVDHAIGKLIMISTDKAANPQSVMGASKRIAELAIMALSTSTTRMNSIRLGNVLGSQGSVAALFLEQIGRRGPVTVTHPDVQRYFLTLRETVELVMTGALLESSGGVWVPDLGPQLKVVELAEHLIRRAGLRPGDDIPITYVGMRPGDKMVEQLIATGESTENDTVCRLRRVTGPQLSRNELETGLAEISEILSRRDLSALIQALCRIVPEYQPSALLLESAAESAIKASHA